MTDLEIKTYLQLVKDAGKFDEKGEMELDKRGKELVVFVDSLKTWANEILADLNKDDARVYDIAKDHRALLLEELLGLLDQKKEKRTF